jgi:alkanesulfonate monooxygenase
VIELVSSTRCIGCDICIRACPTNVFDRAGIGFAEHDERYAYGREWVTIVRELISGRRTSFHGRWFDVDEYELNPKDQLRGRPTIYLGGESDPARPYGSACPRS